MSKKKHGPRTYAESGVDVDLGSEFVRRIRHHVAKTESTRVLHGLGGFAGLFALDFGERLFRRDYKNPVLVGCTDGVGTKLQVAMLAGVHHTVGIDLVAMSVNDLVCTGAEPLFFLDYLATGKLDLDVHVEVVRGIARGCEIAGCALLGGETAEHPGDIDGSRYDLAGFAVGVVEQKRIIDGSRIQEGDEIIGIPSAGLHSNGYSLVRALLLPQKGTAAKRRALARTPKGLDRPLGEELLEPTALYADAVATILKPYQKKRVVHGIAHITGGGLVENAPRVLSGTDLAVRLEPERWEPPAIFGLLESKGVERAEMFRTFNMGIGMIAVVPPYFRAAAVRRLKRLGYDAKVVGRIVARKRGGPSIEIEGASG